MRRPTIAAAAMVVALATLACCAGCSSHTGTALAQRACVYVDASLKLYNRAQHNPNRQQAAREYTRAAEDLDLAEPLAAEANSDDPSWGGLMTTLGERYEIDEGHLEPALHGQCVLAAEGSNGPGGQGGPPVTLPPGVHFTPTSTAPPARPTTTSAPGG